MAGRRENGLRLRRSQESLKEQGLRLFFFKPFIALPTAGIISVSSKETKKRVYSHEQKRERETPLNILVLSIAKAESINKTAYC